MLPNEKLIVLYENYEEECEVARVDEFDLETKTWSTLKVVMPALRASISADGQTIFYEDEE